MSQKLTDEQRLDLAYEMAYYLQHSKLYEVLEKFSQRKKLLQQQFISGVVSGLVAAVGLTIVFSLVAALIGTVGQHLPGQAGQSARHVSQTLNAKAEK